MSGLTAVACSIAPTRRRRFLWAVWWSGPPARDPFRKPDASSGGARSRQEALREAERVAGRHVVEIESGWARAWSRVLAGDPPWPAAAPRSSTSTPRPRSRPVDQPSIWSVLGVGPKATLAEIKRAYHQLALETHPDRGGDAAAFRRVQLAYEQALARRSR